MKAVLLALLLAAPALQDAKRNDAPQVDPVVRQALLDLHEGKDVEPNLARLREYVAKTGDSAIVARDLGIALTREGMHEAAQGFLEIARKRAPKDGPIAQMLGLSFVMQNRHAEGLEQLLAAEKLVPPGPHPLLWQYQSMALGGLQRTEDAETKAKLAITEARQWNAALPPGQRAIDVLDLELNLATIYQHARRFNDAAAVLDRLPVDQLSKKALARLWLARAQLLDAKGDEAGALVAFTKHTELAPDSVEGCYQFALFYVARSDAAKARPLLEKATSLDPKHEGAHFNLARVLTRLGDKDAGKQMMERYRKIYDARIAGEVALTILRNKLMEEAAGGGEKR